MFGTDLVFVIAGVSAIFCFVYWDAIDKWWDRLPKSTQVVAYMLFSAFILWVAGKGMIGDIPGCPSTYSQSYPALCRLAGTVAILAIGMFAGSLFAPVRRGKVVEPMYIMSIVDPEDKRVAVTNIVLN